MKELKTALALEHIRRARKSIVECRKGGLSDKAKLPPMNEIAHDGSQMT